MKPLLWWTVLPHILPTNQFWPFRQASHFPFNDSNVLFHSRLDLWPGCNVKRLSKSLKNLFMVDQATQKILYVLFEHLRKKYFAFWSAKSHMGPQSFIGIHMSRDMTSQEKWNEWEDQSSEDWIASNSKVICFGLGPHHPVLFTRSTHSCKGNRVEEVVRNDRLLFRIPRVG